ncbi:MAG: hypothetical protein VW683_14925 [Betaproteobacteria bacterium]|jgi:hypothetical protein
MSQELREEHVKRLLNDKLFTESIDTLKMQLIEEWVNTDKNDLDGREYLWMELKLLDKLLFHWESILNDGQIKNLRQTLKEI